MKITIDIFCDIIDNYGDIGVAYRLAKELSLQQYSVRIFVNKLDEVSKIIENFDYNSDYQQIREIDFFNLNNFSIEKTANIIIEAFGTEIPENYIELLDNQSKLIIDLEYLSAENWIEDVHLKYSISPKPWMKKIFFMPGFSEKSGGIILDKSYLSLVKTISHSKKEYFNKFYSFLNLTYDENITYINIFTYNWDFSSFLKNLKNTKKKIIFFILDNRFDKIESIPSNVTIFYLPYIKQEEFDIYINLSDFNFVRGEESFIRAILTEKPFLWNIYPQEDNIHLNKLQAFLDNLHNHGFTNVNFDRLNQKLNQNEDFSKEFINILDSKKLNFLNYKNHLIEKCDLVTKLLNFIDSKY